MVSQNILKLLKGKEKRFRNCRIHRSFPWIRPMSSAEIWFSRVISQMPEARVRRRINSLFLTNNLFWHKSFNNCTRAFSRNIFLLKQSSLDVGISKIRKPINLAKTFQKEAISFAFCLRTTFSKLEDLFCALRLYPAKEDSNWLGKACHQAFKIIIEK